MVSTGTHISTQSFRASKQAAWLSIAGAIFGMLAGVVVALNLLALALRLIQPVYPSVHPRSAQQLAMLFATGSGAGELLLLIVLWLILRRKNDSFGRLGLWKSSPWIGWLAGLVVAVYYVVYAVVGFHTGSAHLPLTMIFFEPSLFHIYTALVLGLSAGLCEEVVFRGYLMTRLADAGYGWIVQVIASGALFGLAHGLYGFSQGLSNGLDIVSHTALLGALFAGVYLLSRRSLMPCILCHFLNDAIVLPWVFLQMFHAR
ncbi:MAG: CPBP family intramembrane glutamic endopeptidase [Terracidiphilus sp.]|jgi:membrane protease YdiL (CAAX protease family)